VAEPGVLVRLRAWLGPSLAFTRLRHTGMEQRILMMDRTHLQWNGYTPRIAFTLLYVLSIAIGKPAWGKETGLTVQASLSQFWVDGMSTWHHEGNPRSNRTIITT
jgi:hypothetical protein